MRAYSPLLMRAFSALLPPNARFRMLCELAGVRPKTDVENGKEIPWVLRTYEPQAGNCNRSIHRRTLSQVATGSRVVAPPLPQPPRVTAPEGRQYRTGRESSVSPFVAAVNGVDTPDMLLFKPRAFAIQEAGWKTRA